MTTIIWGILRMNSKILCASNQSVRAAPRNMIGTIISISLQGLKEMMNFTVAPTICSLWKSHVLEDHTKILRSAVSTCLNLMIMCRGCTYNKRVDLKHPNNADEYTGGHLDPYLPYGGDTTIQDSSPDENLDPEEEEAMLQAKEEARLKRIYKCLDDPKFLEKMRRRFKDDPRAEAFFQPQKSRDPQHGTPLADVQ